MYDYPPHLYNYNRNSNNFQYENYYPNSQYPPYSNYPYYHGYHNNSKQMPGLYSSPQINTRRNAEQESNVSTNDDQKQYQPQNSKEYRPEDYYKNLENHEQRHNMPVNYCQRQNSHSANNLGYADYYDYNNYRFNNNNKPNCSNNDEYSLNDEQFYGVNLQRNTDKQDLDNYNEETNENSYNYDREKYDTRDNLDHNVYNKSTNNKSQKKTKKTNNSSKCIDDVDRLNNEDIDSHKNAEN